MTNNVQYGIGLDIGIGSIGWAVISGDRQHAKIENFGTRIFESGEKDKGKSRTSQERRGFRGVRRLGRRRRFRKDRLKAHLQNIGLITINEINNFCADIYAKANRETIFQGLNPNLFQLKVRGLSQQLKPTELAACLLHACNHRGYRDFFAEDDELDQEKLQKLAETPEEVLAEQEALTKLNEQEALKGSLELSAEDSSSEEEEERKSKAGALLFAERFSKSGCRTVSEYILKYNMDERVGQPAFRNRKSRQDFMLIRRDFVRDEIKKILEHQQKYYSQLRNGNSNTILEIIFAQRDFEDGPGDPNDKLRRYTGFLDLIGQCPFYKNEKRGIRATPIGDIFAVVNALSQYRYADKRENALNEVSIPVDLARAAYDKLLEQGRLSFTEVKKLGEERQVVVSRRSTRDDELPKAIKFLSDIRKCVEAAGENWQDYIREDQLSPDTNPSRLHKIAEFLSQCITPRRRREQIKKKLHFLSPALSAKISTLKLGGTSNASYKYMCDAISAFFSGEIYGSFQAKVNMQADEAISADSRKRSIKLAPIVLKDDEIKNNPVVFRAINEVRKVVNSIIEVYGSPGYINIEVASDVNRSFTDRQKIQKEQTNNEKKRDKAIADIANLTNKAANEVSGNLVDRYELYHQQNCKCLYCGQPLNDLSEVLNDKGHGYEVDHIIPYSLILDNTLQNKALVCACCNQRKGQRTPLMYLQGKEKEDFLARINYLHNTTGRNQKAIISDKKYSYLMLESLYDEKARELLEGWKSRNLNDTRYITKYIVELLSKSLIFSTKSKKPVTAVKGRLTSMFRRIWLKGTYWGKDEKERSTTLNHALDAVIIANLTPVNVEIAADANKLKQLDYFRKKRGDDRPVSREYTDYLQKCIKKMGEFWHMSREESEAMLRDPNQVPAYIGRLREEVELRFRDPDVDIFWENDHPLAAPQDREQVFKDRCLSFYGSLDSFIIKPHFPITSRKQSTRFRGAISDSNPIKVRTVPRYDPLKTAKLNPTHLGKIRGLTPDMEQALIGFFVGHEGDSSYTLKDYLKANKQKTAHDANGEVFPSEVKVAVEYEMKISRKAIITLTKDDLAKIYRPDPDLRETLKRIFDGRDNKYTIEKYLKEQKLTRFVTDKGVPVNKVSVTQGPVSNYYRIPITQNCKHNNYVLLSSLKYYCVEVYKNAEGNNCTWGIRYVDIVRQNKKLWVKSSSLPSDYVEHVCYLFANDYVELYDKTGAKKFSGYYQSVYNINHNNFCWRYCNDQSTFPSVISAQDTIRKGKVSLLGELQMIKAKSKPFPVLPA